MLAAKLPTEQSTGSSNASHLSAIKLRDYQRAALAATW